ncbi:MAG TPA: PilN domain-containing protein [Candidatus Saccharimonadia bacterium]|nr:PilN domain-containing protein [Candidatus Saccharimonadia bacterium]
MINLLPPAHKEQLRYARLNQLTLRYLRVILVVIVVLAGIFGASIYLLGRQSDQLAADISTKQETITAAAPKLKLAKSAADRLTTIKAIRASQTRFSLLLDDLAKVLPQGVSIDSITLTGDDTKPVRIAVTGATYDSVLAFREALAASSRISGVDLETIAQAGGSSFQASVVVGFKPGAAR